MNRKYLAFDIETAKEIPGVDFNWKPHRPLGITCMASQATGEEVPRIWMSHTDSGIPAPRMTQSDVAAFILHLSKAAAEGFVPLSWNGLGFDFDVLAEESGLIEECRTLARHHVDMMFHVVCEKGFPVSLNSAASGLGVKGKLAGFEGITAPGLWSSGQYDLVTKYVSQDVSATLAVALTSEKQKSFAWKTRKGTVSTMPLTKGWLTVDDANRLPLPDTSWMTNPLSRSDYLSWLEDCERG